MKKLLKWLAGIVLVIFLLAISLVGRIDRTPLHEQSFYTKMMSKLDTLKPIMYPSRQIVEVGWSETNITPTHPMPMAGYIPRSKFETVHDSLYTRIIALDNGSVTTYLISADLLLFPPALKQRVEEKWKERGQSNYFLYFSAIHTHNGVGGWNDSLLGHIVLGKYHEAWVEQAAESIVNTMQQANVSKKKSTLSYVESDASEWVENRIAFDNGKTDGKIRAITIGREDGSKGILFAFSAHATTISKESLTLSADYPAAAISQLKKRGWSFGMFMAGMVGSHRFIWVPENNFEAVSKEASVLVEKISNASAIQTKDSVDIFASHIPIEFGPSQLRIAKNWKVRDWVFRFLSDPLQGEFTFLEIGDCIFIGTPCDFSGEIFTREELDKIAPGKHVIITSFNGNYAGYITYDAHYETLTKEEVMAMNWVGPYYGQYFTEMIGKLLQKTSTSNQ